MGKELTLLFLNAGRRVELIRNFRIAFKGLGLSGRIVTTDIHGLAPALYLGDTQYILPRSRDPGFLKQFLALCQRENVSLVIPLIDPDLVVLARNRQAIESTGTRVLLSDQRVIEICGDKQRAASFLKKNGFPTPAVFSLREAKQRGFPLFIKPRYGSASLNAYKIDTLEQLEFFVRYVPDPVIQEYIDGEEITTDVFSDWSGKPIIAVPRKRLKVRAGEVSIGRVERNPELEGLCVEIAMQLGTVGPINIQAIQSKNSFYITEINPRFGGGCPLSIAAGAPLAKWVILMALQHPIPDKSPSLQDGLTMMRFDDSFFYPSRKLIS